MTEEMLDALDRAGVRRGRTAGSRLRERFHLDRRAAPGAGWQASLPADGEQALTC